jgi:hypothetical protein
MIARNEDVAKRTALELRARAQTPAKLMAR